MMTAVHQTFAFFALQNQKRRISFYGWAPRQCIAAAWRLKSTR